MPGRAEAPRLDAPASPRATPRSAPAYRRARAGRRRGFSLAAGVVLALSTGSGLATAAAAKPSLSRFSPLSVKPLASLTIDGKNFTSVKSVKIGGKVATFKVASAIKITAIVPASASSGKVVVTTAAGSATSTATLVVTPAPTISGFSPSSLKPLATLTINGKNFTSVKSVKINGKVASFKIASATKISATVPAAATSGKVIVTTAAGSATSGATLTIGVAGPTLVGDATAGKALFVTSCSACHTLKAAGSEGTLGPNLNGTSLTEALLIEAITKGGASVMSPSAVGEYSTTMVAYGGVLSSADIDDLAAFVYNSTHS
jgi:mono/diheme cytochrome c family protein